LFSDGTVPSALKLVDSKVSTTGVAMGTYEPAGEIVTDRSRWTDPFSKRPVAVPTEPA
jgi:hypothetical protein